MDLAGTTLRDLSGLPPTMTIDEAAALYRKSRSSMYRAVQSGQVPAIRIGRDIRVLTWRVLQQLGVDPNEPAGSDARLSKVAE